MKLDKFAIIDALESGNNVAAVQVLFHHFRLGEVPPDLQIIRRVSPIMEMICYHVRCYAWTAKYGFRSSALPEVQSTSLVQIWFPP
jgi:hypothetical protein